MLLNVVGPADDADVADDHRFYIDHGTHGARWLTLIIINPYNRCHSCAPWFLHSLRLSTFNCHNLSLGLSQLKTAPALTYASHGAQVAVHRLWYSRCPSIDTAKIRHPFQALRLTDDTDSTANRWLLLSTEHADILYPLYKALLWIAFKLVSLQDRRQCSHNFMLLSACCELLSN